MKLKLLAVDHNFQPSVFFSVVVPARNEEDNIEKCLAAIVKQHYPSALFEIIVADDYSTDSTVLKVKNLQSTYPNIQLLELSKVLGDSNLNSYKKKAIEMAIGQANGSWIVTTDADCTMGNNWLLSFAQLIAIEQPVFVAAPVQFKNNSSFLSVFQSLDFMSLQGITAASVGQKFLSMCNGANLAYSKAAFAAVEGFKGIDKIASGDDMMLMHKMSEKYPGNVHYLFSQDVIVTTEPMSDLRSFFNQRIRWASKADKYDDKKIIAVLAFVYLFNLSFLVFAVAGFWLPVSWFWLFVMLIAKTLIDLRFMMPVARFFGETRLLFWFPFMQPFHIAYTIIAGWLGKFGKYSWKGRTVK